MEKQTSYFGGGNEITLEVENPQDTQDLSLLGRALSSPIRIEILRLLNQGKSLHLSEIAEKLDLQISSTAFHLQVLEDANLISVENSTKRKGSLKWYSYGQDKMISIYLRDPKAPDKSQVLPVTLHVPIGSFTDASFNKQCGISSETKIIMEDCPQNAFLPEKINAQIIWNKYSGHLTYTLPNNFAFLGELAEINFSLEICSETNGYNTDYPSDITFYVNNTELCTFLSTGDFGDKYGKYTPPWWFTESTKYGTLTQVTIKTDGVYLNEKLVNKKVNLQSLNLMQNNNMLFTIKVKEDAEHKGGFNLFGEKFGEYNQAIIFNAIYKQK